MTREEAIERYNKNAEIVNKLILTDELKYLYKELFKIIKQQINDNDLSELDDMFAKMEHVIKQGEEKMYKSVKLSSDYLFCPSCDKQLDAVASLGDLRPQEGDYSVCGYCATMLEFKGQEEDELHLVALTEEEVERMKTEDLENYDNLQKAVKYIKSKENPFKHV